MPGRRQVDAGDEGVFRREYLVGYARGEGETADGAVIGTCEDLC